VNALTLVVIAIFIFWEAGQRVMRPVPVNENVMGTLALAAIALNGGIMLALNRGQKRDINIRAAFIHMMGDLLGATAILAGAVVIRFTGWLYVDPILSIGIALLIVYSAFDIIRESLNILLEGLPRGMNLSEITRAMSQVEGVLEVHDLHVWSLGAKTHALSSHVLIDDMPPSESGKILTRVNEALCALGIHHTTIQFEHVPCFMADQGCHMTESAHSHHSGHQH
jgi:cobalt-zinc-cadmium efflux system protein